MSIRFTHQEGLIALAAYVSLVAALVVVPRWFSVDTAVLSAAAVEGYSTVAAFWTVVVWSLLVVAIFSRRHRTRAPAIDRSSAGNQVLHDQPTTGILVWGEIALVFVLFALAYCPLFLARYAPYSEDIYFLTALGRMECGQIPYRDFGFLYGPSMIYLLWGWAQVFGVGWVSYYGVLALFEGLQFAVLMGVLQYLVPERRRRYLVFLVLLPFLFNHLFGLNYNATRWLLPTMVVLFASLRPHDRAGTMGCALLLGLHLTYSHEYAIAALMAIVGLHGVLFWHGRRGESIRAVLMVTVGSVAVWALVAFWLMGRAMPAYLDHAGEIVRMMSAGHAAFRFYWTANSLALFGLLAMACAIVGKRLVPRGEPALDASARLMLAALLFALVTLRSGLTRADLWHLNPGFLPLLLAFLLPLSANALQGRVARGLAFSLVVLASATFLVGIAPMGSLYVTSYIRGLADTIAARPTGSAQTRVLGKGLEGERSHPDEELVALGIQLQSAEYRSRPALFYGRAWTLSSRIGICPAHYKLDDLMYTELTRPEAAYLEDYPDTVVVMRRDEFSWLYGPRDETNVHASLTLTPVKQLGRWLSTVHYDAADTEARLQNETRARLTGAYIRAAYEPAKVFGDYVLLSRP
ncbi:MAG: hypothetical protein ACT4QD_12235 [Acidobacteriota bacterium]